MHRLIKIRIRRDLEHLEERVRGFKQYWLGLEEAAHIWRPAADLYETTDGLVLRLEVAGMAEEDLSVVLTGQQLVIKGERRSEQPAPMSRYLYKEILTGAFERSFTIPTTIDLDRIEARYFQGILEVRLPRRAPERRHIPVTALEE